MARILDVYAHSKANAISLPVRPADARASLCSSRVVCTSRPPRDLDGVARKGPSKPPASHRDKRIQDRQPQALSRATGGQGDGRLTILRAVEIDRQEHSTHSHVSPECDPTAGDDAHFAGQPLLLDRSCPGCEATSPRMLHATCRITPHHKMTTCSTQRERSLPRPSHRDGSTPEIAALPLAPRVQNGRPLFGIGHFPSAMLGPTRYRGQLHPVE